MWRLLGTVHAENDNDPAAISAMMRAHKADPSNLEVLLSLGVSHTNELDQAEALEYMRRWLQEHPKFAELASSAALPDGPLLVQPVSSINARPPSLAFPAVVCTTHGISLTRAVIRRVLMAPCPVTPSSGSHRTGGRVHTPSRVAPSLGHPPAAHK